MATQEASGSTTITTVGTEQTIATITTAKPFQVSIDITPLQAGEFLQIRLKKKVLSTSTSAAAFNGIVSWLDASVTPVIIIPGVLSISELDLTFNQLTGTARTFSWAVETP